MPRRMLRMLDPVAEVRVEDTRPTIVAGDIGGKVIGFIDNGWWSLGKVLGRFEELFSTQAHASQVLWKKKPDASHSAPEEIFAELAARCDAVVVGLGN